MAYAKDQPNRWELWLNQQPKGRIPTKNETKDEWAECACWIKRAGLLAGLLNDPRRATDLCTSSYSCWWYNPQDHTIYTMTIYTMTHCLPWAMPSWQTCCIVRSVAAWQYVTHSIVDIHLACSQLAVLYRRIVMYKRAQVLAIYVGIFSKSS